MRPPPSTCAALRCIVAQRLVGARIEDVLLDTSAARAATAAGTAAAAFHWRTTTSLTAAVNGVIDEPIAGPDHGLEAAKEVTKLRKTMLFMYRHKIIYLLAILGCVALLSVKDDLVSVHKEHVHGGGPRARGVACVRTRRATHRPPFIGSHADQDQVRAVLFQDDLGRRGFAILLLDQSSNYRIHVKCIDPCGHSRQSICRQGFMFLRGFRALGFVAAGLLPHARLGRPRTCCSGW